MKNLSRNTGIQCITCNQGNILEIFTLHVHYRDTSNDRIGGDNPRNPISVTSEFSCEHCGQTFKETATNCLKSFPDKTKVCKIMDYYNEYVVKEDISSNQILSAQREVTQKNFEKDSKVFIFVEHKTYTEMIHSMHEKKKEYYLAIIDGKLSIFNQEDASYQNQQKHFEEISNKAKEIAEKSIAMAKMFLTKNGFNYRYSDKTGLQIGKGKELEEVPIPTDAIKAEMVSVFDNDFNEEKYWVPKDSFKIVKEN